MKLSQYARKKLEQRMLKHLPELIQKTFPDAILDEATGKHTIKLKAQIDGKFYPKEVFPDGFWEDIDTGEERGVFDLWMKALGLDEITAATHYASVYDLERETVHYPPVVPREGGELPKNVRSLEEIMSASIENDYTSLIGYENRFLGRRGSLVLIGPSGIGKSSLALHLATHLALGKEWLGVKVRRPLNILVVQRENDDGDLKEMISGVRNSMGLDDQVFGDLGHRLVFWCPGIRGHDFCKVLEEKVQEMGIDVVLIDPLLAWIDGDISSQEAVAGFLRQQLQPVLNRTDALAILVHHTGKPGEGGSGARRGRIESSYSGIGSSEITNWARAIAVITPAGKGYGTFRFQIVKRCGRAGLRSQFTGIDDEIFLQHAPKGQGISWTEVAKPKEEKATGTGAKKPPEAPPDQDRAQVYFDQIAAAGGEILQSELIQKVEMKTGESDRTIREQIKRLIQAGDIHISRTDKPKGGGHKIKWIRAGRQPEAT